MMILLVLVVLVKGKRYRIVKEMCLCFFFWCVVGLCLCLCLPPVFLSFCERQFLGERWYEEGKRRFLGMGKRKTPWYFFSFANEFCGEGVV